MKKDFREQAAQGIFFFCALTGVLCVAAMIGFVFYKGLSPFFGKDAQSVLSFLSGLRWAPSEDTYGIFYMIAASVLGTFGALLIGIPVGVLAAVFLARMASPRAAAIIRPVVELLAGIPSVLYGAFGMGIIVPLIKKISPQVQGQSLLAVMLVLAMMILPTIVSLSESALHAVPKTYAEASLGLGASKMQSIFRVEIPAAKSGILSAAVLGTGRALGETMAVMMIAGNPTGGLPTSLWSMVRPLTTNIAMEMSYASGRQEQMLFATGVVLFIFIMAVNWLLLKISGKGRETA